MEPVSDEELNSILNNTWKEKALYPQVLIRCETLISIVDELMQHRTKHNVEAFFEGRSSGGELVYEP